MNIVKKKIGEGNEEQARENLAGEFAKLPDEKKMSDKKRKNEQIMGRLVFSYKGKLIDVVALDGEAFQKPEKKISIIKEELNKMVNEKVIKESEKFNVRIITEQNFPPAFASTANLLVKNVSKPTLNKRKE